MGDHNISVGVKKFEDNETYVALIEDVIKSFEAGDFYRTVRSIDRHFKDSIFSLLDLVKDERLDALENIKVQSLSEVQESVQNLYKAQFPLMSFMASANLPIPKIFLDMAEYTENRNLKKELAQKEALDLKSVRHWLQESRQWNTAIDWDSLSLVLEKRLLSLTKDLDQNPSLLTLKEILDLLDLNEEYPFGMEIGLVQNWFFGWARKGLVEENPELKTLLNSLSKRLKVHIDEKTDSNTLSL
jgi:hypothetical protein